MRYLLIHYLDETAELSQADDSGAEGSVAARELHDWVTEMETSGVKLYGGALRPAASQAATVRVRDGEVLVSDGPFAETPPASQPGSAMRCRREAGASKPPWISPRILASTSSGGLPSCRSASPPDRGPGRAGCR